MLDIANFLRFRSLCLVLDFWESHRRPRPPLLTVWFFPPYKLAVSLLSPSSSSPFVELHWCFCILYQKLFNRQDDEDGEGLLIRWWRWQYWGPERFWSNLMVGHTTRWNYQCQKYIPLGHSSSDDDDDGKGLGAIQSSAVSLGHSGCKVLPPLSWTFPTWWSFDGDQESRYQISIK